MAYSDTARLGFQTMAEAVPGLAAQFLTVVPEGYWDRDGELGFGPVTVRCPCGASPEIAVGIVTSCKCDRFFLSSGRSVRVARYPGWREREEAA